MPEFHHVSLVVPPATLPEGAKQLPPHLGGVGSEESALEGIGSASTGEDAVIGDGSSRVKLGFYHTPKQFLSMAKTSVSCRGFVTQSGMWLYIPTNGNSVSQGSWGCESSQVAARAL